jgi:hypothetical protein
MNACINFDNFRTLYLQHAVAVARWSAANRARDIRIL